MSRKAAAVPQELLEVSAEAANLPLLERQHVQQVYDTIAQQWHGTRYKAWPRVEAFVHSLPAHSLIADLGCGNGKMAPACRESGHFALACDFSIELVRIAAAQMGMEAQAADVMLLPYRSGEFDAALSIAVLHHVASRERRLMLIRETLRVLRPGGRALFYAWAQDQAQGRSGHSFGSQDVFVPWTQKNNRTPRPVASEQNVASGSKPAQQEHRRRQKAPGSEEPPPPAVAAVTAALGSVEVSATASGAGAVACSELGGAAQCDLAAPAAAVAPSVLQRYCHVYREGELIELIGAVGGCTVEEEYYDTGNWCVSLVKD